MRHPFFTALIALTTIGSPCVGKVITGSVCDTKGAPIDNVVVSDGFSAVKTSDDGTFSIDADNQAYYIFISVPENYAVPEFQGTPFIYKKISVEKNPVNFVLRKIHVEKRFNIIACADIQCRNTYHLRRFVEESVPDIRRTVSSKRIPSYGVILGDMAYTEGDYNANFILPKLWKTLDRKEIGTLMFPVNGNHDFEFDKGELDAERNRSAMVRSKRMYEAIYGPRNYSFNRGNAHIVCMDDVLSLETGANKYTAGFLPEQVEWLRQDLGFVSKEKLVIFCVHIPLSEFFDSSEEAVQVVKLLKDFPNALILAGHTHYNKNTTLDCGIKEHVLAAVSGIWWWSGINADGTPNGYGILSIDGNNVTDYRYKSVGRPLSYQIRAYRGDAEMGGSNDKYGMMKFPYSHDEILANVWNWEEGWQVDLYENGRKTASMEKIPSRKSSECPIAPDPCISQDWWAIGYQTGILGRGNRPNRIDYCPPCTHMFKAKLSNPKSKDIKIIATDIYGHKYVCKTILGGADYTEAAPQFYPRTEAWDATGDHK